MMPDGKKRYETDRKAASGLRHAYPGVFSTGRNDSQVRMSGRNKITECLARYINNDGTLYYPQHLV